MNQKVLYWALWKRAGRVTFSIRKIVNKEDHSVLMFNEWLEVIEKEIGFDDDKIMLLDFKIVEDK